jgi:hypothetical protein
MLEITIKSAHRLFEEHGLTFEVLIQCPFWKKALE